MVQCIASRITVARLLLWWLRICLTVMARRRYIKPNLTSTMRREEIYGGVQGYKITLIEVDKVGEVPDTTHCGLLRRLQVSLDATEAEEAGLILSWRR